eukprot:jgi/Botrbrau1/5011/Bobra.0396s0032.1
MIEAGPTPAISGREQGQPVSTLADPQTGTFVVTDHPILTCLPQLTNVAGPSGDSGEVNDLLQQRKVVEGSTIKPMLTKEHKDLFKKQLAEFWRQKRFLDQSIQQHLTATGRNVFDNESAAARSIQEKGGLSTPLAEGAVAPESTAVAKNARLDPQAEELFLAFFALQDTLTKETAAVLAQKAGCEETQAREYFSKTRSSVRGFLERMVRKAAGPPGPIGDQVSKQEQGQAEEVVDSIVAIPQENAVLLASTETAGVLPNPADSLAQERQARLERHRNFLDANGGIGRLEFVGELVALMGVEKSWEVRCEQLKAIHATSQSAILKRLCGVPPFLPTLESWLLAAEADRQTSFLRHLIRTLGILPLHSDMLSSSNLPKAVAKLQKYRYPDIADAATMLCETWLKLQASTLLMQAPDQSVLQQATSGGRPGEQVGMPDGPMANIGEQGQRTSRSAVDPLATATPLGVPRGPDGAPNLAGAQGAARGFIPRPGGGGNKQAKPLTADEVVRAKSKARPGGSSGFIDFTLGGKVAQKNSGRPLPVLHPMQSHPAQPRVQGLPVTESQRILEAIALRDEQRQQLEVVRRGRLAAESARAAAEKPLVEQMVATWATVWPPPLASDVPHLSDESYPIAMGEESRQRQELNSIYGAEVQIVQYPSIEAIPPSPAEAPVQNLPHKKVERIPFVPKDENDREEQNLRIYKGNVLLPELVDVAKARATEKAFQQRELQEAQQRQLQEAQQRQLQEAQQRQLQEAQQRQLQEAQQRQLQEAQQRQLQEAQQRQLQEAQQRQLQEGQYM